MVKSNPNIWESITENPDGSFEVTLTSPELPWLASMTLSFANWATVLEPPELREIVREWAQSIAKRYQSQE
jgi:predicted DNA-binding transcriptional regulator YafY